MRRDRTPLRPDHRFGPITEKYVIYRGPDTETDGIRYRNIENYLTALGR